MLLIKADFLARTPTWFRITVPWIQDLLTRTQSSRPWYSSFSLRKATFLEYRHTQFLGAIVFAGSKSFYFFVEKKFAFTLPLYFTSLFDLL